MGGTLATLQTKLRVMIGSPSASEVADLVLTELLNYSMREIHNRFPVFASRKEGIIATVAGTLTYALPADCLVIRKMYDFTNEQRLVKKGESYYAEHLWDVTSSEQNKPLYYVRLANTVALFPCPDGIYSIRLWYKYDPIDLAGSSDITVFPATWDIGHLQCARWFYYRDVALSPFKAQNSEREFTQWILSQPSEIMEEAEADLDEAVSLPTLHSGVPRLDFDHSA